MRSTDPRRSLDPADRDILVQAMARSARLLAHVGEQLLLQWRSLHLGQYLYFHPNGTAASAVREALRAFGSEEDVDAARRLLGEAMLVVRRDDSSAWSGGVLPKLEREQELAVSSLLSTFAAQHADPVTEAEQRLPEALERLRDAPAGIVGAGMRHRLARIADVVRDPARSRAERELAASAVLYVCERQDVIPDELGVLGLLDDDLALRTTLRKLGVAVKDGQHWTERAAGLVEEVPFLENLSLRRAGVPEPITWYDRATAYRAYEQVMSGVTDPLIVLSGVPGSSPLYSLLTLTAFSLLEGMTNPTSSRRPLRDGDIVCIDGVHHARFTGLAKTKEAAGWLKLEFRDGCRFVHPSWEARIQAVRGAPKLSNMHCLPKGNEPIQQMFGWERAIGRSAFDSAIVLVTSRAHATEMFENLDANGVPLDAGHYLSFLDRDGGPTTPGARGLLIVSPSIEAARKFIIAHPGEVRAMVVIGVRSLLAEIDQLQLLRGRVKIPLVAWAPTWEASPDLERRVGGARVECLKRSEIGEAAELHDGHRVGLSSRVLALRRAARSPEFRFSLVKRPDGEREFLDDLTSALRRLRAFPERNATKLRLTQLLSSARAAFAATASNGRAIREAIEPRLSVALEVRGQLSLGHASAFGEVFASIERLTKLLPALPSGPNSKAIAVESAIATLTKESAAVVYGTVEQAALTEELFGKDVRVVSVAEICDADDIEAEVFVVPGWLGARAALQLERASPARFELFVDEHERTRWQRFREHESALDRVGRAAPSKSPGEVVPQPESPANEFPSTAFSGVPCAIVTFEDEEYSRALPLDGRLLVLAADGPQERSPRELERGDEVLLPTGGGTDVSRVLTVELMREAERRDPTLVDRAREWRRCLIDFARREELSILTLRKRLAQIGVERERSTLDGWIDASSGVIAPRDPRQTLDRLWPIIGPSSRYTIDEIVVAGEQLRRLHVRSGQAVWAAWKGQQPSVPVDEAWLADWGRRARRLAHRQVVVAVTIGHVRPDLVGWSLPPGDAA